MLDQRARACPMTPGLSRVRSNWMIWAWPGPESRPILEYPPRCGANTRLCALRRDGRLRGIGLSVVRHACSVACIRIDTLELMPSALEVMCRFGGAVARRL